ncbi:H-NS histone family protein [Paraburkholderia agricolaris]|jgi:DNA-binding protein H-NS|uniref:H-NS histone family protein n=1 Tax=Paraburkholderia agricolaris TaxID=2152888 RepID=A0ABW8ZM83_9BURK
MEKSLDGLNAKQLQAVIKEAQAKLIEAQAKVVEETRTKIDALLAEAGLGLVDVYPRLAGKAGNTGKQGKKIGVVAPKYRNPADPGQTWSGRGKKPSWFVEAISKRGVTAESLLIDAAPAAQATRKVASKKVAKKRPARKSAE